MIGGRFGPYELHELLGRGGMGEVHQAYDTIRERLVALKRLSPHVASDPQFQARFRTEARLAAGLDSAHVIPIHDYGVIDGIPYLDMQLIQGDDLGAWIHRDGPLPLTAAVEIVEQIAEALDTAHRAGLVHRDVKPSNILVTRSVTDQDVAYLADFGIARALESTRMTTTGAAVGSIDYMAPERFQHDDIDHRVDVYALACVLFEALTGAKPFAVGNPAMAMAAHLTAPPPQPSQSSATVPATFDPVIARGMAKDPVQRSPSAGELAAAARAALPPTTRTLTKPAPPSPAPTATPRRRRAGLVIAAGLVLLAGGGAVTGVITANRNPADEPVAAASAPAAGPTSTAPPTPRSAPSGLPIGDRVLLGSGGTLIGPRVSILDGVPVLVATSESDVTVVRDLATGEQIGVAIDTRGDHGAAFRGEAVAATVAGRSVLIRGDFGSINRWDLVTGAPLPDLPFGDRTANELAVASGDGRPLLVAADATTVRSWDLTTGQPVGEPATISRRGSLRVVDLRGRPTVLFGSRETGEIRSIDIATGRQAGPPLPNEGGFGWFAAAELPDGVSVLTTLPDTTHVLRDLATGTSQPVPSPGFLASSVTTIHGRLYLTGQTAQEFVVKDLKTMQNTQIKLSQEAYEDWVYVYWQGATYVITFGGSNPVRITDLSAKVPA